MCKQLKNVYQISVGFFDAPQSIGVIQEAAVLTIKNKM